ncbi:MAG: sensor histidine kinase, partial [Deltaproteobacteria bacterium]|nr:sensor histidine kinase [Deltaproteobacteria bacterium]
MSHSWIRRIVPEFLLGSRETFASYRGLVNYRKTWVKIVALLTAAALMPLLFVIGMDYQVTKDALFRENLLRTARTTSNARRTVTFYLEERLAALDLVTRTVATREFGHQDRLGQILEGLKSSFGGFTDLGIVDEQGFQVAYAGPFDLAGRDYSSQDWFQEAMEHGSYISDVFLGYRNQPHLAMAVRFTANNGSTALLRATIDTGRLTALLAGLDLSGNADAFIVNQQGVLQVPSRYHGDLLERFSLPLPEYSATTETMIVDEASEQLILGYAFVERTPFILMILKRQDLLLDTLREAKNRLAWVLILSVAGILAVVIAVATTMIGRVQEADRTRYTVLRNMEHANRMATIGRLAAGVAHEINNPL